MGVELVGPFIWLLSSIIFGVVGAYVARNDRLTFIVNDDKKLSISMGYVCMALMTSVCLGLIWKLWI